jgi:hypothetical protein
MLGTASDAEDAVQEAWLRLGRITQIELLADPDLLGELDFEIEPEAAS